SVAFGRSSSLIPNLAQMLAQPLEHLFPARVTCFPYQFVQSKVHHIAMVQFLRSDIIAEFEPKTMQEIDFLGGEMGRMRPQVKDMFLPVRRMDFERQLRLRRREGFPCQPCYTSLLGDRSPGRKPQNHRR